MELSQEFIEQNGLSEEQVTAFTGHIENEIMPTIKKEYDGVANTNAEGILTGASNYAKEKLGVDLEREKGEKMGDYLIRIADAGLSTKTEALKIKEAELEDKLKNFKGSDELKTKYEQQLSANDELLQKLAKLEPLEGIDEKYNTATTELSKLKKEVSYNSVKPVFPDTVNSYEATAKWNEWKNKVEEAYDIELIDGVPFGIDKENIHKKVKLSELVKADENINALLLGRQQKGTGANPADFRQVEGLPFSIPKNAIPEDITKLVREHVLSELGSITHKDYTARFKELYSKAKNA